MECPAWSVMDLRGGASQCSMAFPCTDDDADQCDIVHDSARFEPAQTKAERRHQLQVEGGSQMSGNSFPQVGEDPEVDVDAASRALSLDPHDHQISQHLADYLKEADDTEDSEHKNILEQARKRRKLEGASTTIQNFRENFDHLRECAVDAITSMVPLRVPEETSIPQKVQHLRSQVLTAFPTMGDDLLRVAVGGLSIS